MTTVYVLIGIPGAGKTTYAETVLKGAVCIGTDRIREEYYGKEMTPRGYLWVRRELVRRVAETAAAGNDVAVDCTNLTKKRRRRLVRALPKGCRIVAVWVDTPLRRALANNAARDRHVPVLGILFLRLWFQKPKGEEGFHEIRTVYQPGR